MRFPSPEDYTKAVQNPDSFGTDDLRRMALADHPVFGVPMPAAGTSAVVFKALRDGDAQALRFFLRADEWTRDRYAAVREHLIERDLTDVVALPTWIDDGIRVGSETYPVVRLPWVDGRSLHHHVGQLAERQDRRALRSLAARWSALVTRLQDAGFAHGDLDHTNVVIDPHGQPRLVDLDCAWVDGLDPAHAPRKYGHRNFQLPTRPWGAWMDTFPGLMIHLALLALADDPGLWGALDTGENILFHREDFQPPFHTPLWRTHLRHVADHQVRELAGLLQEWCLPGRDVRGPLAALRNDESPGEPLTQSRGGVFISYRRADASHIAGRVFDNLSRHISGDRVFIDVCSLEPGLDFTEAIATAIDQCTVLLAVIGPRWADATDGDGRSRLAKQDDPVRVEIEAALRRGIRVIPVLVDGTVMPGADEIPASLEPLTRRHALSIRHESFGRDIRQIQHVLVRMA